VALQERVAVLERSVRELSNAVVAIHGRFDTLEARMQAKCRSKARSGLRNARPTSLESQAPLTVR
jgi:hypothetical protein